MNCKTFQNILLENKISELPNSLFEQINKHSVECTECSSFLQKIKQADDFVTKLKNIEPSFKDEEFIMEKIVAQIENIRETLLEKYLNRINVLTQKPIIRFALTLIIIFFSSLYLYQEFDAVVKIAALEKKNNQISIKEYNKAQTLSQTFESATWLYKFYKFFISESDYVQVTDNMIIIRKDQLGELLKDFNKLDEHQKEKVLQLRRELFPDENSLINKEIKIDKKEIAKKIDQLKAK